MEILVATLAHTVVGKEAEGSERIRLIVDTIRNAYGLISSRFYRGRGQDSYYLMLTTWEDEEHWRKAQERYNPKQLLVASAPELLMAPPKQWLMHYLWGYSRPSAEPAAAAALLATIQPEQSERTQRGWIESLRRQAVQPTLAFAFLARGVNEETVSSSYSPLPNAKGIGDAPYQHGSIFLNLLSWASETERDEFYADPTFQVMSRFLNSMGVVQLLTLEPL